MTPDTRRGPGRPGGATAGDSRAMVLSAARHCFNQKGYAGATTRDISQLAGMQPANLRHHLGSKAEAFQAVYEDCMERVAEVFALLVELDKDASAGAYLRSLGALLAEDAEVLGFLVTAPLERSRYPELQTTLGPSPVALEDLIRSTVRLWAEAGRVAPRVNPDQLADVLIGATYGVVLYASKIDPVLNLNELVDLLARLIDGEVFT